MIPARAVAAVALARRSTRRVCGTSPVAFTPRAPHRTRYKMSHVAVDDAQSFTITAAATPGLGSFVLTRFVQLKILCTATSTT